VSSLEESLQQVLSVDGVRAVALIDIATGTVVCSAGPGGPELAEAAPCVADEARACRVMLGPDRPGGDLDEISLLTAGRIQLARVVSTRPAEGLLLFADLDQARANLGLAARRIGRVAESVLA
jgi:hypothetical protein